MVNFVIYLYEIWSPKQNQVVHFQLRYRFVIKHHLILEQNIKIKNLVSDGSEIIFSAVFT